MKYSDVLLISPLCYSCHNLARVCVWFVAPRVAWRFIVRTECYTGAECDSTLMCCSMKDYLPHRENVCCCCFLPNFFFIFVFVLIRMCNFTLSIRRRIRWAYYHQPLSNLILCTQYKRYIHFMRPLGLRVIVCIYWWSSNWLSGEG